MSLFTDIVGTTRAFFRIGFTGPRLKNDSGTLAIRNAGDSADANLKTALLQNTGDSIEINSDAADTGTDRKLTLSKNPAASAALVVQLPPAKGTDNYILRQKAGTAAGVVELEFTAPGGGSTSSVLADTTSIAFGASSPVAMHQHPAAGVVDKFQIVIDTPFNGTPTLSIGIAGTTSKYVSATDVDLTAAAGTVFEIHPGLAAPGSNEDLIVTYAAGGASAGAARVLTYYVPAPA